MLQNLSLQELEELQTRLGKVLEILNPDGLKISQLYERNEQQTIMVECLSIDVMHLIMKQYQAKRKP